MGRRTKTTRDTRGPIQRLHDREHGKIVERNGVAFYEDAAARRQAPTPEAEQHGAFTSAGMRYRRIPVIETMLERKQLSHEEYRRLAHYRDQASLAERSPVKSCLDQGQGGGGDITPTAAVTSAILTTARIERDLGSLADIARAVAVEDKSLSEWCVEKFGGRERYGPGGKFVAVVPIREKEHMKNAALEIRMAAHRIVP